MTPLFKKMNLKGQAQVAVLNSPPEFEPELIALEGVRVLRAAADFTETGFLLVFATRQDQVDQAAALAAEKTAGDALVWVAYPKMSSKRIACEFNRDTGFGALGKAGFEPVRQVAIDEDWSAVRFRRVEFIKTMRRDPGMALSEQGRRKTSGK